MPHDPRMRWLAEGCFDEPPQLALAHAAIRGKGGDPEAAALGALGPIRNGTQSAHHFMAQVVDRGAGATETTTSIVGKRQSLQKSFWGVPMKRADRPPGDREARYSQAFRPGLV